MIATGSGFEADLEHLLQVTERMASTHADLHRLADDLGARVRALHLTWEGEAAIAHRAAQSPWADGFSDMRDALERMRQAARSAHDNYTAAATANEQLWRDLG